LNVAEGDAGECWRLLVLRLEPKMCGVERDRSKDVADLVSNAMKALHEVLGLS
jgi:hypothetical protein